jgi:hypothetical protein
VQKFLAVLNEIARDYIKQLSRTPTQREPHYEDLFSLSYQAARSETDYTPNLAVVEFFDACGRKQLRCILDLNKVLKVASGFRD